LINVKCVKSLVVLNKKEREADVLILEDKTCDLAETICLSEYDVCWGARE